MLDLEADVSPRPATKKHSGGLCITSRCPYPRGVGKRGYCNRCYRLVRQAERPVCSVPSCDSPSIAEGKCERHYARYRRRGNLDRDYAGTKFTD